SVLKKLEAAGAVFTECSFDTLVNALRTGPNKGSLTGIEAAHIHKEWLNDLSMPVDERVSVPLRDRLKIPASEYEALLAFRGEL
ncbi:hypothetical protein NSP34_25665, partial [Salmonella enterica]|nr:hypothetical protein [Salmonella enterica]